MVLHSDPTNPLVAVNLWYGVGSRDESPGRTGLAHLFEHMLFQGSAHVGTNEHFARIQQVGGVANGSTWFDRTNYFETLPADRLELGLWLESDRMGFLLPALSSEKLENQRQVVMNERRQRVDNQPYGRALERLHELLYPPRHPYHWPVIGTMQDIESATLADVEEFFRRHYVPDNAVLTLAGDFDPATARRQVERYFGELPGGRGARSDATAAEEAALPAREVLEDAVELPRLYLAARCPGVTDPSWHHGALLATALASGRACPMYRDLVQERQLAQSVSAYLFPTELAATFLLVATARPGVPIERVESAVADHLEIAAAGLPAEELERARRRMLTGFVDEVQSLDRRADLLSQFTTFFGDPLRIRSETARYVRPDGGDLARFAACWLAPGRRATLWIVPRGSTG